MLLWPNSKTRRIVLCHLFISFHHPILLVLCGISKLVPLTNTLTTLDHCGVSKLLTWTNLDKILISSALVKNHTVAAHLLPEQFWDAHSNWFIMLFNIVMSLWLCILSANLTSQCSKCPAMRNSCINPPYISKSSDYINISKVLLIRNRNLILYRAALWKKVGVTSVCFSGDAHHGLTHERLN